MGIVVSEQLAMFLRSILLGASLAVVYDLQRLLRRLGGAIWSGLLDTAYCVAASVSLFLFVMAGDGELRMFFLLGAAGGAVLYFCLLSQLLLPLWAFWLEIFLAPLRLAEKIFQKAKKISKKLFSFFRKWFTIIATTHRRRRGAPSTEGEGEMENAQKSGKQPQKKPRRRISSRLTLLLLAVLLLGILVQLRGIRAQIQEAQAQEAAYTERMSQLQEENARLAEDIANSDDPALIEAIARDELGMVGEGEKVFRFQ